jgi:transcriptional regulator with XRE-family HTH domain
MDWKKELKEIEKNKTLEDRQDIDYLAIKISYEVKLARMQKGLTQKELAEKVGTKQSSIARLEAGRGCPSISFLNEIAKALDTYLVIKFNK